MRWLRASFALSMEVGSGLICGGGSPWPPLDDSYIRNNDEEVATEVGHPYKFVLPLSPELTANLA